MEIFGQSTAGADILPCGFQNQYWREFIGECRILTEHLLSGKLASAAVKKKNPAAVSLGTRGGKARAKKLSKKRRKEIARLGGLKRWKKGSDSE